MKKISVKDRVLVLCPGLRVKGGTQFTDDDAVFCPGIGEQIPAAVSHLDSAKSLKVVWSPELCDDRAQLWLKETVPVLERFRLTEKLHTLAPRSFRGELGGGTIVYESKDVLLAEFFELLTTLRSMSNSARIVYQRCAKRHRDEEERTNDMHRRQGDEYARNHG
ncbi:MAG: hypothetical protein NUV80_03235 [Candidatus Berkelbacteria bacterium]|nr:hypothetical protein [Candidatus Berkelbacteria bacterium]MCR4307548.1 hypothetical protein [Candidatus Berkelbacteria bacterium]